MLRTVVAAGLVLTATAGCKALPVEDVEFVSIARSVRADMPWGLSGGSQNRGEPMQAGFQGYDEATRRTALTLKFSTRTDFSSVVLTLRTCSGDAAVGRGGVYLTGRRADTGGFWGAKRARDRVVYSFVFKPLPPSGSDHHSENTGSTPLPDPPEDLCFDLQEQSMIVPGFHSNTAVVPAVALKAALAGPETDLARDAKASGSNSPSDYETWTIVDAKVTAVSKPTASADFLKVLKLKKVRLALADGSQQGADAFYFFGSDAELPAVGQSCTISGRYYDSGCDADPASILCGGVEENHYTRVAQTLSCDGKKLR